VRKPTKHTTELVFSPTLMTDYWTGNQEVR